MLCFLNDDTNVIAPDWLDEMTALALRPEVGVVGARLLYGDGTIQHAGVLLGAFALTHHLLQGRPADFRGYRNRGLLTHAVSAVTAACAVIRLDLFDTLGGFDEALPAAYNDIDLCLPSGARGRYNVIVNRPLVHHFESASRGYYLRPEQEAADRDALHYLLGKWGDGVRADPFYNPNLALDRENYTLAYPPRVPAERAFRFAFAHRDRRHRAADPQPSLECPVAAGVPADHNRRPSAPAGARHARGGIAMDVQLLQTLGRNWWLVLLRGIAAIVFGLLAWAWPGVTLVTLVLFWGAYALVDGVAALIGGWKTKDGGKPMWTVVLVGLVGIAAGIFTFLQPGVTAIALLILIAVWAIVQGVLEISAAIRLRKEIQNEWLLILSGLLSVAFGVLMILNPGAGAIAVLWLIGAFAVAYGVLLVILSFKLKKHGAVRPAAA